MVSKEKAAQREGKHASVSAEKRASLLASSIAPRSASALTTSS